MKLDHSDPVSGPSRAADHRHRRGEGYGASILGCVRRHIGLAAFVVLSLMLCVAAGLYLVHPKYKASAEVMVQLRQVAAVKSEAVVPALSSDQATVSGEAQVIQSQDLLRSVVRDLKLDELDEFDASRPGTASRLYEWARAHLPDQPEPRSPHPDRDDAAVEVLRSNLSVTIVGQSPVLRITYVSQDPAMAVQIANSVVDHYVARQPELKRRLAERAANWITESLVGLRQAEEEATRGVEDFRASSGLLQGRDTTLLRQQLSELSSQLIAVSGERMTLEARLAVMEQDVKSGAPDGSAIVQASKIIQELRTQQAKLASENSRLAESQGNLNPGYRESQAQMNDISRRIADEAGRVVRGLRGDYQAAVQREAAARQAIQSVRSEMSVAAEDEAKLQQLEQGADATRDVYQAFLQKSKETAAQLNFQVPDAVIVSHAVMSSRPYSPDPRMVLPAGLVLSLLGAIGVVMLKEAGDRGFRTQEEVQSYLGLEVIGTIPKMRRREWSSDPNPASMIGTALTDLYLRACAESHVVLVASALPLEGKTTTALCLARIAGMNGRRVLLVDGDLRRASKGPTRPGLADCAGDRSYADLVYLDRVEGVSIIDRGIKIDNPSRILSSSCIEQFVAWAHSTYDLVIIDSAPMMVGPDAWILSKLADRTLFVIKWGETPRRIAAAALNRLASGTVAVALTMVDVRGMIQYGGAEAVGYSKRLRHYYHG